MLSQLWLNPPLAIGRLGGADTPLESFSWGANDIRPRGTAQTTIHPEMTLRVAADGYVTPYLPESPLQFKDDNGFRPVCPFFELHGCWQKPDGTIDSGLITEPVLRQCGIDPSQIRWSVTVANSKPFYLTKEDACKIVAQVEIDYPDCTQRVLQGCSPAGQSKPLVPNGKYLPLGMVQLTRTSPEVPGFRIRFTPAKGIVYGPSNLQDRKMREMLPPAQPSVLSQLDLEQMELCLNADASWCSWMPQQGDLREMPPFCYATDREGVSLGLIDDTCDGIISCWIEGVDLGGASARIVVGPPDFAPDRRPFAALAFGLKDRVSRSDVHNPEYLEAIAPEDTDMALLVDLEILDLLERVFETVGLINLEVNNQRANDRANPTIAYNAGMPVSMTKTHIVFQPPITTPQMPFPLTALARRKHRRYIVLEVFKRLVRQQPDLLEKWVREPLSNDPFFTRQMPPAMRGAHGGPLSLNRRQYDLLKAWINHLRKET